MLKNRNTLILLIILLLNLSFDEINMEHLTILCAHIPYRYLVLLETLWSSSN
jgi:hypothetical protein